MIPLLIGLVPALLGVVQSFFGMKTTQATSTVDGAASVQTSEGHSPINAIVRAMYAVPPAFYFAKIYLWDKVLGLGATDPLSPELHYVAMAIIAFYFVTTIRG